MGLRGWIVCEQRHEAFGLAAEAFVRGLASEAVDAKALLRKAEAHTNVALLMAIGDALSQVIQKDATH